jgi:hypothetical protein
VDVAFALEMWTHEDTYWINLEGPFKLVIDGREHFVVPERVPETVCPALALYRRVIDTVKMYKRGGLEVQFTDGTCIESEPDPQFEAWHLTGPGGLLFVSMPGNQLAIWLPK